MSRDYLGLFDAPPTRLQNKVGLAFAAVLALTIACALFLPNIKLREVVAVIPAIDGMIIVTDLVTGTLFYVQATVFRSRALSVLASCFVLMALLLVAHMLAFPGAFAPQGLIGGGESTPAWTFIIRRIAFPVAVILYVVLRRAESSWRLQPRDPGVWLGVLCAVALAAGIVILLTEGYHLLPAIFSDRTYPLRSRLVAPDLILVALTLFALAVLFWRRKSMLDLWLMAALGAWLVPMTLNMNHWARFTLGFYAEFALMPVAHLILMFALIGESGRLYMRLVLSIAAQRRERDTKLMSVNAMVAIFLHELGQPITAASLSTAAGFSWLDRDEPELDKATDAFRVSLEAVTGTTDRIASLRRLFAREVGSTATFSVNDLARDTLALLQRELESERISIELRLDETVPPVRGDRFQLQQVLVNLLMNAIESIATAQSRRRRITLRSAILDNGSALLEVADTGAGFPSGDSERIFQPFVTTKENGTGLGLPICRGIVENHGGSLSGSCAEEGGAVFSLRMPSLSDAAAEPNGAKLLI